MIPIDSNALFNMTNQTRQEMRLPPVQLNDALNQAALKRANDMVTQGYFSHVSPTGNRAWPFIQESGYQFTSAGENLAKDFKNTNDLYKALLNSPTHKANLTNGKYTDMGIAILPATVNGKKTYYVVQLFGEPKSQSPQAFAPTVTQPTPVPAAKKPIQRKPLPTDKRYAFKPVKRV
jgi:uncharacterized protein YkwD